MNNVRVKLDKRAVREQLLKSSAVAGLCMAAAKQKAEMCGPGYATRVVNYPERTGAIVYPATAAARADNYRNNTLEKVRGAKYNG